METIFEGKSAKATYDSDKKRVVFFLSGYTNPEEHKQMYLKVLELAKEGKVKAFLHDLRNLKGTFSQMNDWLVETFRPVVENGLRYSALILNDDVFTAFAANDIIKKSKILQIQIFKTQEEAEKWLDEKFVQL